MYKELKETEIKTGTQMISEHMGLAILMLNPTRPIKNNVTLEARGTLYAIADEEGLDKLYETAKAFKNQGIKVLVDPNPLNADKLFMIL